MGYQRLLGLLLALAALTVSALGFVVPARHAQLGAGAEAAVAARGRQRGVTMVEGSRSSGRQPEPQHTRKDVLLGLVTAVAGASALGAAPAPSHAWCGKPYPSWAYRIPFNDGSIKARITGLDKLADVFLRVIGKEPKGGADGVPPILLLPTIGMTHDYLETLEALTYGDRQVITFDPVGVGQSSRQLPAGLRPEADATEEEALRRWSAMVVEICKAVVEFLELKGTDLHILGHGAGAIPALVYAAELAAAPSTVGTVRSVTLAEPFLVGGKGALGRPYTAAAQPVPLCVSEAVEGWGPVAAVVKAEEARGSLGGAFDGRWVASPAFDKLAGIPTFVSYGSKNEAVGLDEKAVQWIAARLPAGTQTVVKRFDGTALPHVDLPEAYADWVDENLQRAEGKMRPV